MKTVIFLFVFCLPLYSQSMNPDGYIGGFSLHVSPYILTGELDNSYENVVIGTTSVPAKFNLDLLVAIPVSRRFSLKFFYTYQDMAQKFNSNYTNFINNNISGGMHKIGFTFSFYFE